MMDATRDERAKDVYYPYIIVVFRILMSLRERI